MRYLNSSLALIMLAPIALQGCVPLAVGAGATGVAMASQDRGLEQGINDNEISFEINRKLAAKSSDLYARVSTQVRQGRVVLTGFVANEQDSATVSRIAWSVGGVRQVDNELQTGNPTSFSEKADDSLITTKLRSAILADSKIESLNYSIKTVRGTVYLSGLAKNQAELTRVIGHAREIKGVRNVVSNVDVKQAAGSVTSE
ncbi:MAG: BON domain-containing protein [Parvibaculum sp.]|nr:BON domain-containing protein [Parvibaculum sp.]